MPMMDRPLYKEEIMQIKWEGILAAKKARARAKQVDLEMKNEKELRKIQKIENANRRMVVETANTALRLSKDNFDQLNKDMIGKLKEYLVPAEKVAVGRGNEIEPTASDKNVVLLASVLGQPQPAIAWALGMSKPALTKHFRKELDLGAEMDATFLLTGYRVKAMSGIADQRGAGALDMVITNRTDMRPKGSLDITNSDGKIPNLFMLKPNARDKHISKKEMIDEIKDISEAEILEGDFTASDDEDSIIANGESV